ncbi:hypothetical protein BT63DRAFT_267282 [Microthyrium microscopicum]|uniref:Uncharacterized protein n=1 Tax=Microthyrium microscopicum TaxID=703497 RepID=A0A6A6UCV4_9PEZI|nr:hypothetical protein BT63DRAFT_267282 [Microthyrium microscopicum]
MDSRLRLSEFFSSLERSFRKAMYSVLLPRALVAGNLFWLLTRSLNRGILLARFLPAVLILTLQLILRCGPAALRKPTCIGAWLGRRKSWKT